MSADWHLIQFTSDLRRREPRNIGVAVSADGDWAIRLAGADRRGVVTESVRRFGLTKSNYQQWVDYYTRVFAAGGVDAIRKSQNRRASPFRVVHGGVILGDRSAQATANTLFEELVEIAPQRAADSPAKVLQGNVEKTMELAHIQPTTADIVVPASWGSNGQDGFDDDVKFDYSYRNGQLHFMDRLQLQTTSVEHARVTARDFNARVTGARRAGAGDSFIAFYSGSVVEEFGDSILAPVWRVAQIVDVDRPGPASMQLRELVTSM